MEKPEISIKLNKKTISLDKYAGEWIAFSEGKVVSHTGSLKKLMEKSKRLRNTKKKPSFLLVPKKREGPFIL